MRRSGDSSWSIDDGCAIRSGDGDFVSDAMDSGGDGSVTESAADRDQSTGRQPGDPAAVRVRRFAPAALIRAIRRRPDCYAPGDNRRDDWESAGSDSRAAIGLESAGPRWWTVVLIAVAGGLLAVGFVLRQLSAAGWFVQVCTGAAFVFAAMPAVASLREWFRRPTIDVDLLMLLGAVLAAIIGQLAEGALLLFLFALANVLEEYALARTQRAVGSLAKLMPTSASVLDDGRIVEKRIEDVQVGEIVLVQEGENVPLDGVVREGAATIDEAAITGESLPVDKKCGDGVFAGTRNRSGFLQVAVSKPSGETALAQIVRLVSQANERGARAQRLIDRIGPVYSKGVIAAAVLAAVTLPVVMADLSWRDGLFRGIALLIVASPCALILATPVAYLSSIATAARRGVLIKGGHFLETLASVRAFAFDKTGTLTSGSLRLAKLVPPAGLRDDEALAMAASLEASSGHPLARAVIEAAQRTGVRIEPGQDVQALPGSGVAGRVGRERVWLGKPETMPSDFGEQTQTSALRLADKHRRQGKLVVTMLVGDRAGVLVFEDWLRVEAGGCVSRLRELRIDRVEVLSGDTESVAGMISDRIGADACSADLLPHQKVDRIEALREQYGPVAIVGDGLNDAPALASADVGIAMGTSGIDLALDAADVVLMHDRLTEIPWLLRQARRTRWVVRQNVALAVGVMLVLSVFAVGGGLALPAAVIGHEGSTLLVVVNALRLLR